VNERENRNVLRRFRKTARVEADVTSRGRLFQTRLPATGKARSPTVASRVRRTTNNDDDDERRQRHWTRQHVGCGWRGILERDRPCMVAQQWWLAIASDSAILLATCSAFCTVIR